MDGGIDAEHEIFVLRHDGIPELSTSDARRSAPPRWWRDVRRELELRDHAHVWLEGGQREVRVRRLVSVSPDIPEPRYLASVRTRPAWLESVRLTRRQLEISEYAAGGATVAEIARQVGISEHTVRTHLKAVYRQLGVANRVELALAVSRLPGAGLLESA
jgi:DNA-binding CsgD family transcriptional regulator